jgi:hypothetical protein
VGPPTVACQIGQVPQWVDGVANGRGTGVGHRTRCGRLVSVTCGCGCSPVAERHTYPPSDWNRLCRCACSRKCSGAVAASREHAVGVSPLLLCERSPMVLAIHAYCMTWSYAGLVAAGCGQLTVAVGQDVGPWLVPVAIGMVLSNSGVVIFGRVPSTLDRMLAER